MSTENKSLNYQKMLAYLGELGADLGEHAMIRLARASDATFGAMDRTDLLHYQRVLEATIDNRNDLMDREALKAELTDVVRERFIRGAVSDKAAEAREFRTRLASM